MVTVVTIKQGAGGIKAIVTIVTTVTGAGAKVKGAYLRVEIAARQYNPYPLTFGPRRTLAGWWKGCAFPPAQRRVAKFRRGAGCPFQRAALLGEPSADGGGKAPTPPRRAQMRF